MTQNRIIMISEHAVDRFIERFQFAGKESSNESQVRIAAERAIVSIWQDASYISDDPEGILFRNREFFCDFIVYNKMIKTLFPTKNGQLQPENHSRTELALSESNGPAKTTAGWHNSNFNSRFRKQSNRPNGARR